MKKIKYILTGVAISLVTLGLVLLIYHNKESVKVVSNTVSRNEVQKEDDKTSKNNFENQKDNITHIEEIKAENEQKAVNEVKAKEVAEEDRPLYPKEVFLTFDDGPSPNNTLKVLKTLNDNNIKATFFEIGRNAEMYPEIVKQLVNSGMTICNHSYTHDYKMYSSVKSCFDDFNKSKSVIEGITGEKLPPFMRFPGGSDNQVSNSSTMDQIRHEAVKEGLYFTDWYPSSSDAAPAGLSSEQIYENVTNRCKELHLAIVLMHDAPEKATSAEALPRIVTNLKQQGFVFRSFKDITHTEIKEMIKLGLIDRGIK